ncbi:TPA: hypothetical protein N0F65_009857, partial [Lagenidium giganteum]
YDGLGQHISRTSNLVHQPHFENGLLKLQAKKEADMTREEIEACDRFLAPSTCAHASTADSVIEDYNATVTSQQRESQFVSVDWIPPTSNACERLFSTAGNILRDQRKSMHPFTFEAIVMLKYNKEPWSATTVQKLMQGSSSSSDFVRDHSD